MVLDGLRARRAETIATSLGFLGNITWLWMVCARGARRPSRIHWNSLGKTDGFGWSARAARGHDPEIIGIPLGRSMVLGGLRARRVETIPNN